MKKKVLVLMMMATMVLSMGCGETKGGTTDQGKEDVIVSEPLEVVNSETIAEEAETTEPESEVEVNTNSNTSNKLEKVEQRDYTTITCRKYDIFDENEMPIGSKITAYPLDITEVLSGKMVAREYGMLYEGEWVTVSGYVHYQKDGFFVLSPSNNEDVEKYVGTIVVEDKNINLDCNWNIKDGDYITVAGLYRGTYLPTSQEYYVVIKEVFIVE